MSKHSDLWKSQEWKKLRQNLFRLQKRVFKAVRAGDFKKAKSLQKLIQQIPFSAAFGCPSGHTAK
ncbi:reverse transcriptase N-terminal domain-containing protein [Moorena sp. SIO4A1]|uniref:reverse transcriptase N-terminal domain-containing protein n=1 Tax=Moorena sp. SIO4A1 TaxID=2607835 RepID=UPI00344C7344